MRMAGRALAVTAVLLDVCRSAYSTRFYQDIDWPCYARDAEQLLGGDFDYDNYLCEWGRMYYPAAFAYTYAAIYALTGGALAGVLALAVLAKAALTYNAVRLFQRFTAPRHHWIYVLLPLLEQNVYRAAVSRVTNDLYVALLFVLMLRAVVSRRYRAASACFAFAAAFKMNTFFLGPALLFTYLHRMRFWRVVVHFAAMGAAQVVLALPFLLTNARAYVLIAYNFGRDFEPRVNMAWGFLGDTLRRDPQFYRLLLVSTVLFLAVLFAVARRLWVTGRVATLWPHTPPKLRRDKLVLLVFVASQVVCYTFSRGVHIQFLLWIAFSLPFLFAEGAGLSPAAALVTYLLFDWCHSWVPNVIQPLQLGAAIAAAARGDGAAAAAAAGRIMAPLASVDPHAGHATIVPMLGKYFETGFGPTVIPASFVMFAIEVLVLVRVFRRCGAALRRSDLKAE